MTLYAYFELAPAPAAVHTYIHTLHHLTVIVLCDDVKQTKKNAGSE